VLIMGLNDLIGLLGILIGLGLLIWLAFKGWSVLLLAPIAALAAAAISREPLLAHWTQIFMRSAAGFFAQFFLLFLLGALFGKLMEDSGSVSAIADYMTRKLQAGILRPQAPIHHPPTAAGSSLEPLAVRSGPWSRAQSAVVSRRCWRPP
jgi:hypothetical protein